MRRHLERTALVVAVAFVVLVGCLIFASWVGVPPIYSELSLDLLENAVGIGVGYLLASILVELQRRHPQ